MSGGRHALPGVSPRNVRAARFLVAWRHWLTSSWPTVAASMALCGLLAGCGARTPGDSDGGSDAGRDGETDPDGAADAEAPPLPRCWESEPTWSTQSIDPSGRAGNGIGLSLDDADGAHLSYWVNDEGEAIIRSATNVSGSWRIDDVARDANLLTSLAVGADGQPHIAFSTGTGRESMVHHASLSAGGWAMTDVASKDGNEVRNEVAIVVDSGGVPSVAYWHCLPDSTCSLSHAIAISTNVDGAWHQEDVAVSDPSTDIYTPGPTDSFLAAGPDGWLGLLVIERQHEPSNETIEHRLVLWERQEGAWSRGVVASRGGDMIYRGALAASESGELAVAYVAITYEIRDGDAVPAPPFAIMVARRTESGWQAEQVEEVMVERPSIWDLAVDSSGAVVLLYRPLVDVTRLATNACGGTWATVDLDALSDWSALAVDRAGHPSVAYFRPVPDLGLWLATLEETFAR